MRANRALTALLAAATVLVIVAGFGSLVLARISNPSILATEIAVDGVNYPKTGAGIQEAIDDCAALLFCGKVTVASGSYPAITSPIAAKSGITVEGASTTLTTAMTETASHRGIFTITDQNDVTITGFNLSATGSSTAITSYGHQNLTIRNNTFSGAQTGSGAAGVIALEGNAGSADFDNTAIEDNRFVGMPASSRVIYLYARGGNIITNTRISGNHFEGTRGPATYLDDYDVIRGTIVTNNTYKDLLSGTTSTTPGIALFAGLALLNELIHDTTFSNNHYHNTLTTAGHQQGLVYFSSAINTVITNNTAIGSWTTSQNTQGPAIAPGRISTPSRGIVITGNTIEGFDAPWDPDSMTHVEVANNVVRNSGSCFNIGYGTQQYVDIHHNICSNSVSFNSQNALIQFGNSNPLKTSIRNNTYIDTTNPATTTRVMRFTGNYDFSDVVVEGNRFYVPNGTPSFLSKELGSEDLPLIIRNNELENSASITYNGGYFANGQVPFFAATTTGSGTTTNGVLTGDNKLFWDNANKRLGVGTVSPSDALEVVGNIRASGGGSSYEVNQSGAYYLEDGGTNHYLKYNNNSSLDGALLNGFGGVAFAVQGAEKMRVNGTGVGVGTASPAFLTDWYSTATTSVRVDSNSASKGACFILKDRDGSGYTYVTANNGVLTASTVACN